MNSISSSNPHTYYQPQGWPQNQAQSPTVSAVSVEQVQNTSTPPEPLDYHKIILGNDTGPPTKAERNSVSDILVRLQSHADLNVILMQLLDVNCKLILAKQRLSRDQNRVQQIENQCIELHKALDAKVNSLTFDFLDTLPITNNIECYTWIYDDLKPEEPEEHEIQMLSPFARCIVAKKMRVMWYNIQPGYISQNALLRTVVFNKLWNIPFNLDLPANRSSNVIVVVLMEIGDNQAIDGVKVMCFLDRSKG